MEAVNTGNIRINPLAQCKGTVSTSWTGHKTWSEWSESLYDSNRSWSKWFSNIADASRSEHSSITVPGTGGDHSFKYKIIDPDSIPKPVRRRARQEGGDEEKGPDLVAGLLDDVEGDVGNSGFQLFSFSQQIKQPWWDAGWDDKRPYNLCSTHFSFPDMCKKAIKRNIQPQRILTAMSLVACVVTAAYAAELADIFYDHYNDSDSSVKENGDFTKPAQLIFNQFSAHFDGDYFPLMIKIIRSFGAYVGVKLIDWFVNSICPQEVLVDGTKEYQRVDKNRLNALFAGFFFVLGWIYFPVAVNKLHNEKEDADNALSTETFPDQITQNVLRGTLVFILVAGTARSAYNLISDGTMVASCSGHLNWCAETLDRALEGIYNFLKKAPDSWLSNPIPPLKLSTTDGCDNQYTLSRGGFACHPKKTYRASDDDTVLETWKWERLPSSQWYGSTVLKGVNLAAWVFACFALPIMNDQAIKAVKGMYGTDDDYPYDDPTIDAVDKSDKLWNAFGLVTWRAEEVLTNPYFYSCLGLAIALLLGCNMYYSVAPRPITSLKISKEGDPSSDESDSEEKIAAGFYVSVKRPETLAMRIFTQTKNVLLPVGLVAASIGLYAYAFWTVFPGIKDETGKSNFDGDHSRKSAWQGQVGQYFNQDIVGVAMLAVPASIATVFLLHACDEFAKLLDRQKEEYWGVVLKEEPSGMNLRDLAGKSTAVDRNENRLLITYKQMADENTGVGANKWSDFWLTMFGLQSISIALDINGEHLTTTDADGLGYVPPSSVTRGTGGHFGGDEEDGGGTVFFHHGRGGRESGEFDHIRRVSLSSSDE